MDILSDLYKKSGTTETSTSVSDVDASLDEVFVLDPDRTTTMKFSVSISGINSYPDKCCLVIEDNEINYLCKATLESKEDNLYKIIIPPMKGKLPEKKTISANVFIVVEGQYFELHKMNMILKSPVKIKLENIETTNSTNSALKETIKKPVVQTNIKNLNVSSSNSNDEKTVVEDKKDKKQTKTINLSELKNELKNQLLK